MPLSLLLQAPSSSAFKGGSSKALSIEIHFVALLVGDQRSDVVVSYAVKLSLTSNNIKTQL
jgi:hypothetical protein